MISGKLATQLGYEGFFILVLVVTIPAIVLSLRLPFAYSHETKEAA